MVGSSAGDGVAENFSGSQGSLMVAEDSRVRGELAGMR